MKFKEFYITDKEGNSNCVIRSFCKLYNDTYENVLNELLSIKEEIKAKTFNDVDVFETYMKRRDTEKIDYGEDMQIKDLELDNGNYIVFCWDKGSNYHMVTIIDKVLYDRNDSSFNQYVITVYKQKILKKALD